MIRGLLLSLLACAVFVLGPQPSASAEDEVHPEWGSTSAPDAVLKRGCKKYTYSYQVTPPEGYWSLELFFKGPKGKKVASAYFLSGGDPEADTETLELCRRNTRAGRYTIKAFLSVEDNGDSVEGWLPDSHFRLHRPKN